MDVKQIRRLESELAEFLDRFHDCFLRKDTRSHLGVYVRGQLSDLPEKSVEPIALEAGVAPRTLQEFLAQHRWDEDKLRDRLHRLVATEYHGPQTVGLIDETSDPKKGDKTPGVQKQWCGRLGKTENCMVTVHLGLARGDFHCLLDGELFLPESWDADRERCREAGIPDDMVHRPKWKIALELYDRAVANEVSFDWLTFDEGYGNNPEFLRELSSRQQKYVAEVPKSFIGWLEPPRVVTRRYHKNGRGRGRKVPRLASNSRAAQRVDALLDDPKLRDKPWQRFHIKNTEKGPMVWECKHAMLTIKGADGLPGETLHLVVARNVLNMDELKFFVSNALPETSIEILLLVAFSRWRVERCFEDQKSEIGLDQYEGRRYLGLKRHMILSCVSFLLLSRVRSKWGEKPAGVDGLPTAHRDGRVDWLMGHEIASIAGSQTGEGSEEDRIPPTTKRRDSKESLQASKSHITRTRHRSRRNKKMSMGCHLAL